MVASISGSSSVSEKQLRANRRNARKSTGPRTADGKARSSKNATTHGIFCEALVLPDEDPKLFEQFRYDMLRSLLPRNIVELQLCERIVSANWKLHRVAKAEREIYAGNAECGLRNADCGETMNATTSAIRIPNSAFLMAQMFSDPNDPALDRLQRYERRLEHSMHQAMNQLRQCKKGPEQYVNDYTEYLTRPETFDPMLAEQAVHDECDDKEEAQPELAARNKPILNNQIASDGGERSFIHNKPINTDEFEKNELAVMAENVPPERLAVAA